MDKIKLFEDFSSDKSQVNEVSKSVSDIQVIDNALKNAIDKLGVGHSIENEETKDDETSFDVNFGFIKSNKITYKITVTKK